MVPPPNGENGGIPVKGYCGGAVAKGGGLSQLNQARIGGFFSAELGRKT